MLSTQLASAGHLSAGSTSIVNPTGGVPLSTGGSATPFRFQLPLGAACTGDSPNVGYRIQSYLVPQSVALDTLKFDSSGPVPAAGQFRAPMFDTFGTPFVDKQTAAAVPAGGPGPIIQPLASFDFAVYDPAGFPLTPGVYNVGIACTLGAPTSATQLDKYWNTVLTIRADPADTGPAKIRWIVGPPPVVDFAGDGTTDRGVFRSGAWHVQGQPTAFFGLAGDAPVPGDYDGDGDIERAVFRDGAWYVEGQATVFFGLPGDLPVPDDYDGDGDVERAVFRDGAWYVEGQATVFLGLAGDVPVPADYDGDGNAERGVYRSGAWYVEGQPTVFLGLAGSIPVPGDYDGSGDAERAVYGAGAWYVEGQPTVFLGLGGNVPVPGDYDGNGDTERAVYAGGAWYVEGQATVFFGLSGDVPLPIPQGVYRRFF